MYACMLESCILDVCEYCYLTVVHFAQSSYIHRHSMEEINRLRKWSGNICPNSEVLCSNVGKRISEQTEQWDDNM